MYIYIYIYIYIFFSSVCNVLYICVCVCVCVCMCMYVYIYINTITQINQCNHIFMHEEVNRSTHSIIPYMIRHSYGAIITEFLC